MPTMIPSVDESEDDFVIRFTSDETMQSEFEDSRQRESVARNIFKNKDSSFIEVLTSGELYDAISKSAVPPEENEITQCFVSGDDGEESISSTAEILAKILKKTFTGFTEDESLTEVSEVEEILKTISGSSQNTDELGYNSAGTITSRLETKLADSKIVDPPYPPLLMSVFLEISETHYRCVRTKVADSLLRNYILEAKQYDDGSEYDPEKASDADKEKINDEVTAIRNFIEECNERMGFEGVLERAGMDYESIGWAAVEVIRSRDMKVAKLAHIPASRIKVIEGWQGFVEGHGTQHKTFYQNFGEKVVINDRLDPFTKRPEPYNPRLDGELEAASSTLEWNMIDRHTGERTDDFTKSANEILFIPKHSNRTIYYGFTDIVPAIGAILGNVHIRDYLLQFFEHNTIPRYAIIIENAKIANDVKDAIMKYFSEQVKGKHHKTLIIPVPSTRGEVKVRFEKLAADTQEGSFQETKKNNNQDIMTAHGVSPAIIGVSEHSELGSGKGLSQAEIYKDRIISPSQRRWALYINKLLRSGLGISMVRLSFNPLDIRDLEAEMRVFTGYGDKMITSINEIRRNARIGDPVEGGDRLFMIEDGKIFFLDEMGTLKSTVTEEAALEEKKLVAQEKQAEANAKIQEEKAKQQPIIAPPGGVKVPAKKVPKKV
jgi:capsid portal protein